MTAALDSDGHLPFSSSTSPPLRNQRNHAHRHHHSHHPPHHHRRHSSLQWQQQQHPHHPHAMAITQWSPSTGSKDRASKPPGESIAYSAASSPTSGHAPGTIVASMVVPGAGVQDHSSLSDPHPSQTEPPIEYGGAQSTRHNGAAAAAGAGTTNRRPPRRRAIRLASTALPAVLVLMVGYIYYVYTVRVCIDYILRIKHNTLQAALYLVVFNVLIALFLVSYVQSVFRSPGSASKPPVRIPPPPVPRTTTPFQKAPGTTTLTSITTPTLPVTHMSTGRHSESYERLPALRSGAIAPQPLDHQPISVDSSPVVYGAAIPGAASIHSRSLSGASQLQQQQRQQQPQHPSPGHSPSMPSMPKYPPATVSPADQILAPGYYLSMVTDEESESKEHQLQSQQHQHQLQRQAVEMLESNEQDDRRSAVSAQIQMSSITAPVSSSSGTAATASAAAVTSGSYGALESGTGDSRRRSRIESSTEGIMMGGGSGRGGLGVSTSGLPPPDLSRRQSMTIHQDEITMPVVPRAARTPTTSPSSPPVSPTSISSSVHSYPTPIATLGVSKRDGQPRWCDECEMVKPDRSHHCSECGYCVLRMDHHCPWVNGCVGFGNYKCFYLFILYASISTTWVVGSMAPLLLTVLRENNDQGPSWSTLRSFDIQWVIVMVLTSLLALLIIAFTTVHTSYILGNRTTIEALQDMRSTYIRVQYRKMSRYHHRQHSYQQQQHHHHHHHHGQSPNSNSSHQQFHHNRRPLTMISSSTAGSPQQYSMNMTELVKDMGTVGRRHHSRSASVGSGMVGANGGVAPLLPFLSEIEFNVVKVAHGERLWDRGSWLANWKSVMGESWWLWFVPYGNTPGDGIHDVYNEKVYARILADALAQARMQAVNFGGLGLGNDMNHGHGLGMSMTGAVNGVDPIGSTMAPMNTTAIGLYSRPRSESVALDMIGSPDLEQVPQQNNRVTGLEMDSHTGHVKRTPSLNKKSSSGTMDSNHDNGSGSGPSQGPLSSSELVYSTQPPPQRRRGDSESWRSAEGHSRTASHSTTGTGAPYFPTVSHGHHHHGHHHHHHHHPPQGRPRAPKSAMAPGRSREPTVTSTNSAADETNSSRRAMEQLLMSSSSSATMSPYLGEEPLPAAPSLGSISHPGQGHSGHGYGYGPAAAGSISSSGTSTPSTPKHPSSATARVSSGAYGRRSRSPKTQPPPTSTGTGTGRQRQRTLSIGAGAVIGVGVGSGSGGGASSSGSSSGAYNTYGYGHGHPQYHNHQGHHGHHHSQQHQHQHHHHHPMAVAQPAPIREFGLGLGMDGIPVDSGLGLKLSASQAGGGRTLIRAGSQPGLGSGTRSGHTGRKSRTTTTTPTPTTPNTGPESTK